MTAVVISIATNADTLQMLRGEPLGWTRGSVPLSTAAWAARITGWLITTGAVSLGAPFWFDVLNRFARPGGDERTITGTGPGQLSRDGNRE